MDGGESLGGRAEEAVPGRNPDWSRDETVLLLDLYRRVSTAGKGHPEVIALSALLHRAARGLGSAPPLPSYRNPAGIAMRLRNIARRDPEAAGRPGGLREGGAVDQAVWEEFGADRQALRAEAARIVAAWAAGGEGGAPPVRSSRGPAPSFGQRTAFVEDGAAAVYVLRLEGAVEALLPGLPADEVGVFKIGRSNDVDRRLAELSAGLPPGSAVRWAVVARHDCGGACRAHSAERRILDGCDARGWSTGGEFARAPPGSCSSLSPPHAARPAATGAPRLLPGYIRTG